MKSSNSVILSLLAMSMMKKIGSGNKHSGVFSIETLENFLPKMPKDIVSQFKNANSSLSSGESMGVEVHGNSMFLPELLENNSIDCVITSPPYYDIVNYTDSPGQIGLQTSSEEYIRFLVNVFAPFLSALKDEGSLFVNIGVKQRDLNIYSRFVSTMESVGWSLIDQITWVKSNPSPTTSRKLRQDNEFIFVFGKKGRQTKLYSMVEKARTAGRSLGAAPRRNKNEVVRILKEGTTKKYKVAHSTWTLPTIAVKWNSRERERIFLDRFSGTRFEKYADQVINKKHQAIMNPIIARNCIWLGTRPGDIIVDPFSGMGTVTQMAKVMGRVGIGLELDTVNSLSSVIGRNIINSNSKAWDHYTVRDLTKTPYVEPVSEDDPLLDMSNTRAHIVKKTLFIDAQPYNFSQPKSFFPVVEREDVSEHVSMLLNLIRNGIQ